MLGMRQVGCDSYRLSSYILLVSSLFSLIISRIPAASMAAPATVTAIYVTATIVKHSLKVRDLLTGIGLVGKVPDSAECLAFKAL